MNNISFDWEKLNRLKTAYNNAVKSGQNSFIFEGHELLTNYAKYLIEYLNSVIRPK